MTAPDHNVAMQNFEPLPPEGGRAILSRRRAGWCAGALLLALAGCSSAPLQSRTGAAPTRSRSTDAPNPRSAQALALPPDQREALLARALLVVNTPYTYGGNTPEGGFDCSGLIQYAVRGIHGIAQRALPRTTAQWAQVSAPVQRTLERGDFVFFNTLGNRYSHMGIYVGSGQFVHAPSSGGTVQRVRMDHPYFAKRFTEARSIFV